MANASLKMLWNKLKAYCKNGFHKFSDNTSMHGFNELYYSKNLFWKLFWLTIIGCSVGITLYQISKAISQYTDQSTTSSIQIAAPSDVMYPPLRICYPHWLYWIDWERAQKMNFTNESILFALSYLTQIYTNPNFDTKVANKSLHRGMRRNKIKNLVELYQKISEDSWHSWHLFPYQDLLDSTNFYFDENIFDLRLCSSLNESEILSTINYSNDFTRSPQAENPRQKSNRRNELQLLVLHKSIQGSYQEEYTKYIKDWYEQNYYNQGFLRYLGNLNYSSAKLPILIFPNSYDKNYVSVFPNTDVIRVSIKASIHKWKNSPLLPCEPTWRWIIMNSTCKNECLKQALRSENLCNPAAKYFLSMAFLMNNLALEIIGYDRLKIGETSDGKTAGTSPFPFVTTTVDQTSNPVMSPVLTTTDKISNAAETLAAACWQKSYEEYTNCTKICNFLMGCHEYNFDFTVQPTSLFYSTNGIQSNTITNVIIEYPTDNEILVICEEDQQTWEEFVGNVGGLLGIWTGASIISFIQIFYLCCCADCDKCPFNIKPLVRPNPKLKRRRRRRVITVGIVQQQLH